MQMEEQEYVEICDSRGPPPAWISEATEEDAGLQHPTVGHGDEDTNSSSGTSAAHPNLLTATTISVLERDGLEATIGEAQPSPSTRDTSLPGSSALFIALLQRLRCDAQEFLSQMSVGASILCFLVASTVTSWILGQTFSALARLLRAIFL